MRKNSGKFFGLCIVIAVILLLTLPGCVQDTFSRVEEPPQNEDGTDNGQVEDDDKLSEEEERRLAEEKRLEERRLREEALKVELSEFFVPLAPEEQVDNPHVKAKGIYVSGHTVGHERRFSELLELVESTELNTMVIDVKNDHGSVTYKSDIEVVKRIGSDASAPIKDVNALMETLRERNIYPIARVVVFRDPHLPEKQPEWAIQKRDGSGSWRDRSGYAWVNPYEKNVWDYNIAIAKEAALKGFREIQFDYVRFPENAEKVDREAYFPGSEGIRKDEAIERFLTYAREQLADYNVHISADVFGVIATSWGDSDRIGQNWEKMSPLVEIISPMIYPSHYGAGYFGFAVPDANPAGTIRRALEDAIKRNAPLEKPAVIRPWLQSFTATWVKGYIPYGPNEVRKQIDAARDLGIDEYLIWNASNRFYEKSFLTEAEAADRETTGASERNEKGFDVLGRTAEQAVTDYFTAVKRKRWRDAYTWQAGHNMEHEAYRSWFDSLAASLISFNAAGTADDKKVFLLDFTFVNNNNTVELTGEKIPVYLENNVWRVEPSEAFLKTMTEIITTEETSN